MIGVDCILNVHRERPDVLRASLRCLTAVMNEASYRGVATRLTVVLDRATAGQVALVETSLASLRTDQRGELLETDLGDLGEARNAAISQTDRPLVAFFDADDLWSREWVAAGAELLDRSSSASALVVNSDFNVVFDERKVIEVSRNLDSPHSLPSAMYAVANFSTSQIITSRALLEDVPFPSRSDDKVFGFEDWEWSRLVSDEGVRRRSARGTVHFVRRESGSASLMRKLGARLPRPTHLLRRTDSIIPQHYPAD